MSVRTFAIVIVILLGFIAVMGATWASWGTKQRERAWWRGEAIPNKRGLFNLLVAIPT